jgi:hypothetical protein
MPALMKADRERLAKLLGMLGSENTGERDNATLERMGRNCAGTPHESNAGHSCPFRGMALVGWRVPAAVQTASMRWLRRAETLMARRSILRVPLERHCAKRRQGHS